MHNWVPTIRSNLINSRQTKKMTFNTSQVGRLNVIFEYHDFTKLHAYLMFNGK